MDNNKKLEELEEYNEAFKRLVEMGLVEIDSLDENGNPLYKLTDEGKKIGTELFGETPNND